MFDWNPRKAKSNRLKHGYLSKKLPRRFLIKTDWMVKTWSTRKLKRADCAWQKAVWA
jgi:hypothetical protein